MAYRRFTPRPPASTWTGEPIVEVPYAIGASVALSYALMIAHELGVAPITDDQAHSRLLASRLQSAALDPAGLPGVYQQAETPYKRRQVELRVAGMLAPAAVLRRLSMQEIVAYRDEHRAERRQLTQLIEHLTDQARHRPWDRQLDEELDAIAERTRQIADGMPGWSSAWLAARGSLAKPSMTLKLAASTGFTAYVAPHVPLVAALGAGALTLGAAAKAAALDAFDQLRRARTPEENAVAYLLDAGGR